MGSNGCEIGKDLGGGVRRPEPGIGGSLGINNQCVSIGAAGISGLHQQAQTSESFFFSALGAALNRILQTWAVTIRITAKGSSSSS